MTEEEEKSRDDDWENRVLCSDGNCIGVIGPDGRCKECGLAYDGELPWNNREKSESDEDADEKDSGKSEAEEKPRKEKKDEPETDESWNDDSIVEHWEHRVLCVDGNCIGVIGTDGKCKECGKPGPKKK